MADTPSDWFRFQKSSVWSPMSSSRLVSPSTVLPALSCIFTPDPTASAPPPDVYPDAIDLLQTTGEWLLDVVAEAEARIKTRSSADFKGKARERDGKLSPEDATNAQRAVIVLREQTTKLATWQLVLKAAVSLFTVWSYVS